MSFVNRLRLFQNYLRQAPVASHGPVEIGIEITNQCNLNCIMCNRRQMKRPIGRISWPLFQKIVDQTCHTAEIYNLFGLGEPLLHSRLPQMIDYCHQKGVPVALSTNITLLNQQRRQELIAHPPDFLLLALDTFTPTTYQKITRRRLYHQAKQNLEAYLAVFNQQKPPTYASLLFVEQELNKKEKGLYRQYWRRQKAPRLYFKPVTSFTHKAISSFPPKRCLFPWRNFLVTWQGDVYPCCFDTNADFKLGNITRQSVKAIWNSPNWQKLRKSFYSDQVNPLCQSCQVYHPSLVTTAALTLLPELSVKKMATWLPRLKQPKPNANMAS